jgi:hypothetical protein
MKRRDLVLAALAAADGRPYTPVQIQKALFLISQNVPETVTEAPRFNFVPYDYGPFDQDVYSETEALARGGEAVIAPSGSGRWNTFAASDAGLEHGKQILAAMPERSRKYIIEVSQWVRAKSFSGLVRSIYDAYPSMKAKSIFRG